eukprot:1160582-Pelagomonas_calceolata.AAC.4
MRKKIGSLHSFISKGKEETKGDSSKNQKEALATSMDLQRTYWTQYRTSPSTGKTECSTVTLPTKEEG